MVFPDHTGHLGTLSGGRALAWMNHAPRFATVRRRRCALIAGMVDDRTPGP
jgi:acyl-CoA hydrolase